MRYLDSILNRRALLNTSAYEKNKHVAKKYDFIANGLFHKMMLSNLYETNDKMLANAIHMIETSFLYIYDMMKRVRNFDNYMQQ